ncbi:MAG TPA: hypothetical protein DHV56_01450 [Rhodobacter sp.]|nr:hypothetical protein [Rhodobacter sp.]
MACNLLVKRPSRLAWRCRKGRKGLENVPLCGGGHDAVVAISASMMITVSNISKTKRVVTTP